MLHLTITPSEATFTKGTAIAGIYNYRDSHKPFVHPLNTPLGHCVSLASPHDHVHHKGLMYSLRAKDVNFWEERATMDHEVVGFIRHRSFEEVAASGTSVGFTETLHWSAEDGSLPSFDEVRTISLSETSSGAFQWKWRTELTALRDMELVQSQWSTRHEDGRITNYHGLGLRLIREFGGQTGNNALILDGTEVPESEAMGASLGTATFIGTFDGVWPMHKAAVSLKQGHGHTLYALKEFFAWMSYGPTNKAPLLIKKGAKLEESYEVTVEDLDNPDTWTQP